MMTVAQFVTISQGVNSITLNLEDVASMEVINSSSGPYLCLRRLSTKDIIVFSSLEEYNRVSAALQEWAAFKIQSGFRL